MKRLLAGRGTAIAVVGVLLALIAGGSYAVAASGSKTITVCVHKNGGGLYKARKCKKHDSKVTWNQQGPAGKAGKNGANGLNGAPGAAGTSGPQGSDGFQQIGTFGGSIDPIPANVDAFVFAGPTTQVTTGPTQGLTASGSAALGATNPVRVDVGICKQPAAGGDVTILTANQDLFQVVDVTTTRVSFGMSQTAAPGAGTWNVGMCVLDDDPAQAVDDSDFSEGYAFVTSSSAPDVVPAPVMLKSAKAARAH